MSKKVGWILSRFIARRSKVASSILMMPLTLDLILSSNRGQYLVVFLLEIHEHTFIRTWWSNLQKSRVFIILYQLHGGERTTGTRNDSSNCNKMDADVGGLTKYFTANYKLPPKPCHNRIHKIIKIVTFNPKDHKNIFPPFQFTNDLIFQERNFMVRSTHHH